jgi:GNAT superfamily N-acetyltransferase
MSKSLNLRPGPLPGDLSAITAFHMEYYGKLYGWNQEFEAYVAKPLSEFVLRKDPREGLWVLEDGKKICGAIALVNHQAQAQLRWYYVDPAYQGMGYGKRLMAVFLDHAKEWGYSSALLWTVDLQKEAIGLYRKNGFELVEEKRHKLWGDLLNEQCYRKSLE